MTYNRLPADTAQRLRAAGLKVIEIDGYQTRERPASTGEFKPPGVLNHHTGALDVYDDFANDLAYAKWMFLVGRPADGLPPPLVQMALSLEGVVFLGSLGRANHAGKAKSSGSVAAGDGNALYVGIEWMLSGTQPIPAAMYKAGALLNAVLLDILGSSERAVSCHYNTSVTGKWDIGDPNGILVNGHRVLDVSKFRLAVRDARARLHKPVPKPRNEFKDFKVHLVPGNKRRTVAQIKTDMQIVKKHTEGASAVVFNTERETAAQRKAVADGLGKGWTRVVDNENTIAYGSNWHQKGKPSEILLAKQDPSKAKVSPNRKLSTAPLENKLLEGTTIKFKGTHLLSEANCIHTKVYGRAWREKMWPIQLNDALDSIERDHKAGFPVVFAGDLNTGVRFTGKQLFALLQKRFGSYVTHVHNGKLDHIFLISTSKVKLSELGQEINVDNTSDHNMVTARIRATVL